jgi:membrane dipeptidase
MKFAGFLFVVAAGWSQSRKVTDEEVRRVHESALLIDTHNDVTSDTIKGIGIGHEKQSGHTDIPRLRRGGVGAVFFAAYVSSEFVTGNRSAHRALEMIDTIRFDIVDRHRSEFQLALSADDILAARKAGKIAALIGIEGGHAIEDSPRLLRAFYALGVRYLTLTHSNSNNWADSSGSVSKPNNGLSPLGKEIIAEMNRIGMMVDVSHVSDKTFHDALAASTAPPFASHSSCRAISNIPRNMTDEMISALARKGGVIQINFGCEFLSQDSANTSTWTNSALKRNLEAVAAREARTPAQRKQSSSQLTAKANEQMVRATLADVVAHIGRVVEIAGIGAVGIGSDFDGVGCVPKGLDDVSKFPALTRALLEKGYTAEQIRKIYGENVLRVMRAVEARRIP